MLGNVKPLSDRLANELEGTTADPEAVMEIFFEWFEDLVDKGHLNWRRSSVKELGDLARDHN
jgi:hypothetical protein